MGDVVDMMEKQMPFEDDKLNRLVFRAASSICTAMSLEHQVRRAAVMKRAKLSFINNMGSSMAGIGFDMVSAVSNFFESVADYDEATVRDKVMMGQIWDAIVPLRTSGHLRTLADICGLFWGFVRTGPVGALLAMWP